METPSIGVKVRWFLVSLFNHLEATVPFDQRPMSNKAKLEEHGSPIIQLVSYIDVIGLREPHANFIGHQITGQIFSLSQFINAAVNTIQQLPEKELPDCVIQYVEMLVDIFATKANEVRRAPLEEEPPPTTDLGTPGAKHSDTIRPKMTHER